MTNTVVTIILFGVMVCAADVIYKNLHFLIMRHKAMKAWEQFKEEHPDAESWQEYEAGAQEEDDDFDLTSVIQEQNLDGLTGNSSIHLHLKDQVCTRLKEEAKAAGMSPSEYTNRMMVLLFDMAPENKTEE